MGRGSLMTARRCCEGPEELQTLESMSHANSRDLENQGGIAGLLVGWNNAVVLNLKKIYLRSPYTFKSYKGRAEDF